MPSSFPAQHKNQWDNAERQIAYEMGDDLLYPTGLDIANHQRESQAQAALRQGNSITFVCVHVCCPLK